MVRIQVRAMGEIGDGQRRRGDQFVWRTERSRFRKVQVFLISAIRNHCNDRGDVAQLGERLLCKQEVVGSSPIISKSLLVGRSVVPQVNGLNLRIVRN